ncbi:hypothetical protein [Falsigemmobacter faecalis]|uniref:Uncharacterized protein n=1 Tax=Falsigemmobacter faecalis TaxID=2488730 RepID=A0A3P3DGU5_9RHOB|nr:hypothetical protein [Falsigemmobacter faecalis]RRH73490.1 hypothetical protein EG244_12455 [Falsigemmobacter faecalis]
MSLATRAAAEPCHQPVRIEQPRGAAVGIGFTWFFGANAQGPASGLKLLSSRHDDQTSVSLGLDDTLATGSGRPTVGVAGSGGQTFGGFESRAGWGRFAMGSGVANTRAAKKSVNNYIDGSLTSAGVGEGVDGRGQVFSIGGRSISGETARLFAIGICCALSTPAVHRYATDKFQSGHFRVCRGKVGQTG